MADQTVAKSFSWRRSVIKEGIVFGVTLIALALLWHPDIITNPSGRFLALVSSSTVSPFHPLIWSGILYLIIGTIRLILAGVRKLQKKQG